MQRRWRERDDRHSQDRRPNRREIPMAMTDDRSLQVMLLGLEADRSIVPVVSFAGDGRRVRNVQQHASWMLQTFLGASCKADSLYDIVNERKLQNEAEELGIDVSSDGVQVGQVTHVNYPPYQAIGVSGKHSVMFALVVRMVMAEERMPKSFWEVLEPYGLAIILRDIITQLQDVVLRLVSAEDENDRIEVDTKHIPRSLPEAKAASQWNATRTMCTKQNLGDPISPPLCDGIQLWIVNGNVPVINLPQSTSIFCEHVSWMLQVAMGSEGKAKDLMEYIEDYNEVPKIRRTYEECRSRLSFSDQDIALVRLSGLGNEVLAVGAAGKRSCMLAAVVAIALQDDNLLKDLDPQIRRMYPDLLRPFRDLVGSAVEAERQGQRGGSHGNNKNRRASRSRDRRR